jgi:GTPase SAR1 family protein
VLDCCHYISNEAKRKLEAFLKRKTDFKASHSQRLPVTVLGLSGCGKTSILDTLVTQAGATHNPPPTTATRDLELQFCPQLTFDVRDVCGADPTSWVREYTGNENRPKPHAIVFVLDSTNAKALPQAGSLFRDLIALRELDDVVFVIVANKQGYMERDNIEPDELTARLGIDHRYKRNVAFITCNARLGAGVLDVFQYIAATVPGFINTKL